MDMPSHPFLRCETLNGDLKNHQWDFFCCGIPLQTLLSKAMHSLNKWKVHFSYCWWFQVLLICGIYRSLVIGRVLGIIRHYMLMSNIGHVWCCNTVASTGCYIEIDENRFEQELVFYLEKFDITEEKVRLENHINYFNQVMDNDSPNGKKLGFIAQEMGREINTIGSKANHAEIQKIVVQMKDELEKIKEQLLNVL